MREVASTHAGRWAWAEIDLDAFAHNVEVLRTVASPAAVWAVVKADGYGHGSVRVAERALAAGAAGLGVALASEGVVLRDAGIDAPILVLTEQPPEQVQTLVEHAMIPTVYTVEYAEALAATGCRDLPVHLKVDTGMQRVGAPLDVFPVVASRIAALAPAIRIDGVFTHLACADEPTSPATMGQLARFDDALAELDQMGIRPSVVHAANSAGALAFAEARRSLVRTGIAMYGISPGDGVDDLAVDLRPVMSLRARVAYVKRVVAGSRVAYGWRHEFDHDTTVATLPLGYADGVPRRLGTMPDRPGADVLIGGRRCPIVGVVTMDQIVVDVGDAEVSIGDEAVLIGRQGDEVILATDWAERLGTIGYEIVCGINPRIPRVERRREQGACRPRSI